LPSNVVVRWFGLEVVSLEQDDRKKKIEQRKKTFY
jgi:hypothetical protein